jgi:methylenetetrahydrofolate reductase (NADPH)
MTLSASNAEAAPADNTRYTCQRPKEADRLFVSDTIEKKIREVKRLIRENARLAWMFENCFPNTLDTTVHYDASEGDGKEDMGAEYAVTQLFYDNAKYFDFVEKCREAGVTMPLIPGIKPFAKLSQLTVVPKTFHCDLPLELAEEVVKCKTDEDAKQLGIEWSTEQCRQLYRAGIRNIHFYTVSAVDSVREVAKRLL